MAGSGAAAARCRLAPRRSDMTLVARRTARESATKDRKRTVGDGTTLAAHSAMPVGASHAVHCGSIVLDGCAEAGSPFLVNREGS